MKFWEFILFCLVIEDMKWKQVKSLVKTHIWNKKLNTSVLICETSEMEKVTTFLISFTQPTFTSAIESNLLTYIKVTVIVERHVNTFL